MIEICFNDIENGYGSRGHRLHNRFMARNVQGTLMRRRDIARVNKNLHSSLKDYCYDLRVDGWRQGVEMVWKWINYESLASGAIYCVVPVAKRLRVLTNKSSLIHSMDLSDNIHETVNTT